jgi:hypothetical protein
LSIDREYSRERWSISLRIGENAAFLTVHTIDGFWKGLCTKWGERRLSKLYTVHRKERIFLIRIIVIPHGNNLSFLEAIRHLIWSDFSGIFDSHGIRLEPSEDPSQFIVHTIVCTPIRLFVYFMKE